MYEKMRTKPLFGRGKLQKMLLVTRIGLLCILAFNITAAANVFSQAFNLKMNISYFFRSLLKHIIYSWIFFKDWRYVVSHTCN